MTLFRYVGETEMPC